MKKSEVRADRTWVLYVLIAVFLAVLGVALAVVRVDSVLGDPAFHGTFVSVLVLVCAVILVGMGVCLLLFAFGQYQRSMRIARRRASAKVRAASARQDSGLYITAVGGGTGLSTILRGLKEISSHINAIVAVTDDGGSSGRLLEGNTVVPPGDIRNCLVALSPREGIMEAMFNYRFENPAELRGHSLGNLMIAGLSDLTGDTATAVQDIGHILNIRGNVIPVTLDDVTLGAKMSDGAEVYGETTIVSDPRCIREVFLRPHNALVNADAVEAIVSADVVLLGPGSLYTSILPNLLVPGIIDALVQTKAPVWYVANIMTQRGETEGYNLSDHIEAIVGLSEKRFLSGVIVNTRKVGAASAETYRKGGLSQVETDTVAVKKYGLRVVGLPLAKEDGFVKHDAAVLADFIATGKF